jgi:hypothetical protein
MPSAMRDARITIPANQRRRRDWALRLAAVGLRSMTTAAQVVPGLVGSLKPVVVPRQPDLDWYVRDPAVWLVLGKALALQAYQSSLVADDSRFDQFADGNKAA